MLALGMPQERLARLAARRTFVDMKQRFISGTQVVPGQHGQWLRDQVRLAQDPVDLWLLRGAVFDALQALGPAARGVRLELHRTLSAVFPDTDALMTVARGL